MARVLTSTKSDKSKKSNRRAKKSRQPQESRQPRKARHNNNCEINKWSEQHMKGAIDEYHSSNGSVSVRQLARAWNVPRRLIDED